MPSADRAVPCLVTSAQLQGVLERYPSRRGAWRLKAVLAQTRSMTRSDGERRLLTLLGQADARLAAAGYRVLRFTGRQLHDEPMLVVARIAQALGGAGA